MNEGNLPLPDRNEQHDCVERYEAMLHRNDQYFFDVEEFELIIEHYLEANDLRKAKSVLDYAKRQHPGSLELLFAEAHVLGSMGKLNSALGVLDIIGRMEPLNEDVHLHKAGIYSQLRNYRKAIEHYKRALELAEEGKDDIYLDLAFEYENIEDLGKAIQMLQHALELNPENEAVLYELAYCYELMDAHAQARDFFQDFTNEHPYSFVAWYNLGNALARLDELEASIEALDLCLAIEERFTSAHFSKARNLLVMGRYHEAIACYRETLEHDGPQAVTFSYIGECFEKLEEYEQALIHYDQSIALDPNWVDAWIGRGVVKDMMARQTEALKDLEVAIKLAPELGDAWYFHANVLGRMGRYEQAFASYTTLNTLEAENLDGWLEHSDLLLEAKGPEAALNKLREAEMLHKLNGRYRYRMASLLLRCGMDQQGLLELEEALTAAPKDREHFFAHYPEAARMPQVVHLMELYGS